MTEFSHTEKYNALEPQARPPVGDSNTDLADALKRAYCSLATGNTAELAPLYSEDVYFEDPSHGIQGKAALLERFQYIFTAKSIAAISNSIRRSTPAVKSSSRGL